jgi:hypothetical protein
MLPLGTHAAFRSYNITCPRDGRRKGRMPPPDLRSSGVVYVVIPKTSSETGNLDVRNLPDFPRNSDALGMMGSAVVAGGPRDIPPRVVLG